MASINKVFMTGRLTRDPELIPTKRADFSGCRISIATDFTPYSKDSTAEKEVCFVECTLWGKMAENAISSLHKGNLVSVEGRLKQDTWLDKTTGSERTKHVIVVQNIVFIEKNELRDLESEKEPIGEKQPKEKQKAWDDLPF